MDFELSEEQRLLHTVRGVGYVMRSPHPIEGHTLKGAGSLKGAGRQ